MCPKQATLNLDVRQLIVKSVLGISRTGDDRREIYVYKAEVYLVPHDEVVVFAALQKCRPGSVGQLRSCLRAVTLVFQSYLRYKSCCIVLDAFEEPGVLGSVGVPCSRCVFQARTDEGFVSDCLAFRCM